MTPIKSMKIFHVKSTLIFRSYVHFFGGVIYSKLQKLVAESRIDPTADGSEIRPLLVEGGSFFPQYLQGSLVELQQP